MKKYVVKLLFPDDSAYVIFEDNTLYTTKDKYKATQFDNENEAVWKAICAVFDYGIPHSTHEEIEV